MLKPEEKKKEEQQPSWNDIKEGGKELGPEEMSRIASEQADKEYEKEKEEKDRYEIEEDEEEEEPEEEATEEEKEDEQAEEEEKEEGEEPDNEHEEEEHVEESEETEKEGEEGEEETKFEIEEEERNKIIKQIMEKEEVDEEEANEQLDKHINLVKKYKGKPVQLARAYWNSQKVASKAQNELDAAKKELSHYEEQSQLIRERNIPDKETIKQHVINGKLTTKKGQQVSEGQVIDTFRRQFPTKSADMSDAEILDSFATDYRDNLKKSIEQAKEKRANKARKVRKNIVKEIDDESISKDVEAVLDEFPDEKVASDAFAPQDVINWAKGRRYDELKKTMKEKIEKARKEGIKQGKEDAEILGVKTRTSKEKRKSTTSKKTATLNASQKERAVDMFLDNPGFDTKEDCYEAFKEYLESFSDSEEGKKAKQIA